MAEHDIAGEASAGAAPFSARLRAFAAKARDAFITPRLAAQGVYIDPLEHAPPDISQWRSDQREAFFSQEMELFRECLRVGGLDVREGVLDDLSQYYKLPPEECRQRCLHWEEWSLAEWRAAESLQAFYDSTQSWSFDLLWHAYLQTCGFAYPSSIHAARFAKARSPGGAHLDFGSGTGITSQLFGKLGYTLTLADISRPLLDFALWRLERRGQAAQGLNLTVAALPANAFDFVTALDALVHVEDFDAAAAMLHRAIKPGGWLLTNFDIREKDQEKSATHLYHDDLDLEYRLQRAGFVRRAKLGGVTLCYQRVEAKGALHAARGLRDGFVLKSSARHITHLSRRLRMPPLRRIMKGVARLGGLIRPRN